MDLEPLLERFSGLIQPGRTVLDVGCGTGLPADAYLVGHGIAVNGLDASPENVERARENVPGGFFEVRDVLDLGPDEYCVEGVVSLSVLARIPRPRYPALFAAFASYMPKGGPVLLALRRADGTRTADGTSGPATSERGGEVADNEELLEGAGFVVIANEIGGTGDEASAIVLARL
jgi:SAM-dependent methyltransferase